MKATGIVRRIDELGRVVIPKEMRRTLRIREGDPIEIYAEKDELVFKKYSPVASVENISSGFAKILSDVSGYPSVICDSDSVVSVSGYGFKSLIGKKLSKELISLMRERKSTVQNIIDGGEPVAIVGENDIDVEAQIIMPVTADGDLLGAVALMSDKFGEKFGENELKLVKIIGEVLSLQFRQ